jgi:23S rRNA pseudouridine1911/1915/1917 synthase
MSEPQLFRVLPKQVDQTIAAALREWLPGQSWSETRKLVTQRRVLVNGNLCVDAGRRLRLTDVVKVLAHSTAPPPTEHDVRIRYLDEHVVVVEKPAGMTSTRHSEESDWPARRKQLQPTLDELIPHILVKKEGRKHRKGVPPPVRAVHRLDRETSGLMIFARTSAAERSLSQQFREHTTHRRYLAVVPGDVAEQTIETRLVRDRGDGRRGGTKDPEAGKAAVTHIHPLERLGAYTLVECRLKTGRTHQIRIHLAERGHPLCGERVYNQPLFGAPLPDVSGAPRVALHAAELAFDHPLTGERMQFEMPLPDDLDAFVRRLRQEAALGKPVEKASTVGKIARDREAKAKGNRPRDGKRFEDRRDAGPADLERGGKPRRHKRGKPRE